MLKAAVDLSGINAALDGIPAEVVEAVAQKVKVLATNLQHHIVADKLQGQVLNHKSGALARSIQEEVTTSGQTTTGKVFSAGDVKYAAIHEFGGTIPAHDIIPVNGKALAFMVGGSQVFAAIVHMPDIHMPERSFMRSSLGDQAEEIVKQIRAAAIAGANKAMKQ